MRRETGTSTRWAALYIRVSTTDQGTRFSPASQEKSLREKAARDGYGVREEHIFRDEVSGKSDNREALKRMRALAKTGAFQIVLVFSVDRFARKVLDALSLLQELKKSGVTLDFVEMPYEDTPTGRFTFVQMAAAAEYIGEKILADSRRGRKQKLEGGKLTNTAAAYGYKYIDKKQPNGSRFEIDAEKAPIVRDIFNWRRNGDSPTDIARRLNDAGIRSSGHWGRNREWVPPGLWSRQTIQQMLVKPVYCGRYSCGGIVVPNDAIVDEATWQAVQDINPASRLKKQGRPPKHALLPGFIWCGKCKRRIVQTGKVHIRCGNFEPRTRRRICHAPAVLKAKVEQAAWSLIWGVLKNPELLMRLGREWHKRKAAPENTEVAKAEKELAKLRSEEATIVKMMKRELIGFDEGEADIKRLRARISTISEDLRIIGRVVEMPTADAAKATLRRITEGPEPSTCERRRAIFEKLLDLRMEYRDGYLEIEGKVPVAAAVAGSGGKNCKSRVDTPCSSFLAIPFVIREKVA